MRPSRILILLAALAGCQTSDLTLPAPPAKAQPGTVYGRVVYAKAGQSTPIPAAGASVVVLGTSLSAISKADGNFLISGITQSTGTLLFRFDSTGSGMVDHQRAIQLQDIGAGEGRQIGLGDVAVTQNATMHGKVALGDKPTATTGLGGTTVFVPAGPFTTYTNDDGSYKLEDLPEGIIHVTFFHSGYDPYDLANVSLRAGEDFPVADIVLTPQATPPPPGNIHGRITFVPPPDNVTNTLVSVVDTAGHALAGQVSADASFSIPQVPAGLYDITVAHTGYTTAVIHNILVGSSAEITLPQVTLQAGNGTVDCIPDDPCAPTTPCHTGKVNCSSGTAVCVDSGLSVDGTLCGSNKYCHAGSCGDCTPNADCDPLGAACHKGAVACGTGLAVCVDTNTSKTDGQACGVNQVCKSGQCSSCQQGLACTPTEAPCHTGSIDCATGSPVCSDTQGILENGSGCGTDKVCSGGVCVACAAGGVCSPVTSVCHHGTFACNTGVQICVDDHTNLDNGTTCGMDKVCNTGSCVACATGASCTPSGNACHAGVTSCISGGSQCVDTNSPAPEGTPCGSMLVCHAAVCVPSGFSILSGDAQSVKIDSAATPVVIQLNDQNGAPIIGAAITVASPDGAAAVLPPSGQTDANGQYIFAPVMPRDVGSHMWTVSSASDHIAVTATATAPAASVSHPLVNLDHTDGNSGVPGAGILAHVGSPRGLALAADGTIYFTEWDQHRVRRLSPTGQLTTVAGTGSGGFSGDGLAATAAQLYNPHGVALDEAHHQLYVSDYSNNAIRNIDLQTGLISTIAGRGGATGPAFGDGGSALGAAISNPTHLAMGPDGLLYVTDSGHGRIRKIDLVHHTIAAWVTPSSTCPSDQTTWLYSCSSYYYGCSMAWDAAGNAYVSGTFVGSDFGPTCSSAWGIAQVSPDATTFTHVAGYYSGTTNDGAPAASSALPGAVMMAFDAQGNLFFSSPDAHIIRRIDATSGRIATYAGTSGSASYSPPFTAAATTKLSTPHTIAFDGSGNLIVADYGNASITEFSAPGSTSATTTTLTKNSGDGQTVVVNQQAPLFLTVKLTDDSGPLSGYPVRWTSVDEGGALNASVVNTDLNGIASVSVRVGRQVGSYHFRANYAGLGGTPATGSPVTFTLTSKAATAGDIYTLVNVVHTSGVTTASTPGTLGRVGNVYDPITASDGTIYFSDQTNHYVWKLSPGGLLSILAGNGGCGSAGDGGQATQAQVCYPWGLALEEATNTLYIADNYTDTIRALKLTTGVITRFAGGGSAGSPDYGDGGPATNAVFQDVSHLSIGPGRQLYVADYYQARIRKIDLASGSISNWLRNTGSTTPYAFYGCGYGSYWTGCSMAWDAAGNAYIAGYISGTSISCSYTYGVMQVSAADGSINLIAGACSGTAGAGAPGPATTFDTAPSLALDTVGNIYIANGHNDVIERIDGNIGTVVRVSGTRNNGSFSGEEVPASGALLNTPSGITFDPDGNLIIADTQSFALRTIAGIGATAPDVVTLAKNGGDAQSVVVDQLAGTPLSVKLSDAAGALTGFSVRWTSLDPGAVIGATGTTTDQTGVAATTVRVGRAAGTYRFRAAFTDIHGNDVSGSPVTFSVTATAAPVGHIYTAVNLSHGYGITASGTAGTMAKISSVNNVIATSDNTLYIADAGNHMVWKLSPQGVLTAVAGNTQCGKGGDSGLATDAQICTPWGLAIDEAAHLLYVGDNNYDNIRLINLTTGLISLYAGGGSIGSPSFGDGDVATNAQFQSVTHLRIGPDGLLYVTDYSMGRIRTINRSTKQIQTWLQTAPCASAPVVVYGCGSGSQACEVRWDTAGNAYVSGDICGSAISANTTPGIIRISAADQSRTVIVGSLNGSTLSGVQASSAKLAYAPSFAIDSLGNLFLTINSGHTLFRVDATNGQITTLAGNGSSGYAGDEVVSTAAQVNGPAGLDIGPTGDLFFADYNNYAVRTIASVTSLAGGGAKLALNGGNGLTPYINQQLPQSPAMSVKLTTTAGAPLNAYTIKWSGLDLGGNVLTTTSTTDTNGIASVQARVGLSPGTYRYTASFQDVTGAEVPGSPVTFTQTAVAPDVGDIFTVLNVNHTSGNPSDGQAATSFSGSLRDVAVGADGTLYYVDYGSCSVRAISPEGVTTTIAGTPGSCGNSGNNGPATSAKLQYPIGVAIDPTNTNLYVSDSYYNLVRRVDLVSGNIYAFAGGGTAGAPDYGDDTGTAQQAVFSYPTHLAFGPDGNLYITDTLHERIRYVDPSGYIHKFIAANSNNATNACGTAAVVLRDCYYTSAGTYDDCQVTWDAVGNAYVSGTITGTAPNGGAANCNFTSGILRIDKVTGALSHVAGKVGGNPADGQLATAALFYAPPTMAIDALGNIFTVDVTHHQIRRIDHSTGAITTVAGNGTAGYLGDYALSTSAILNAPWMPVVTPDGHLVFTDQTNYAVREIW